MATVRPNRSLDPYAQEFWEHTKNRELRLQRCTACGKFRFPPSAVCDACLSEEYEWALLGGAGKVLAEHGR